MKMDIIRKTPYEDGSFPAQTWHEEVPPNGYAVIADSVDMADFYAHNGFITPTIEAIEHTRQVPKLVPVEKTREVEGEDEPVTETYYEDEIQTVDEVYTVDTMTDYEPNTEAWEAWKASLPTPSKPEPTTEERLAALEEQLAQADDTAIELYEMQMEQEAINAAQDDALIEIYEMIGG